MAVAASLHITGPRAAAVLVVALVVGSLTASPASAGTTIGSTFTPGGCNGGITLVQTSSPPGTSYTIGSAGVITSWRFQAATNPVQLEFKVFRPAGGTSYSVVGSSEAAAPPANALSTYPIRIPVQAGDLIGETLLTSGNCAASVAATVYYVNGDLAVGATAAFQPGSGLFDIAATLEADVDGDGYGDETQDGCPGQPTQAACDTTAPVSRFTGGPRRTARSTATFAFASDDPGARFECRITGRGVRTIQLSTFLPCTSPKTYTHLKRGKYQVSVRAIDTVGNVEAVPATVKLKVQKKKKKRKNG
jgi:hypothetical protein